MMHEDLDVALEALQQIAWGSVGGIVPVTSPAWAFDWSADGDLTVATVVAWYASPWADEGLVLRPLSVGWNLIEDRGTRTLPVAIGELTETAVRDALDQLLRTERHMLAESLADLKTTRDADGVWTCSLPEEHRGREIARGQAVEYDRLQAIAEGADGCSLAELPLSPRLRLLLAAATASESRDGAGAAGRSGLSARS